MKSMLMLLVALLAASCSFAQENGPDKKSTEKHAAKATVPIEASVAKAIQAIDDEMIAIKGGGFIMGCTNSDDTACYYWEKPDHSVTVSSFSIGKYAITQKQWYAIMGTKPWIKDCDDCPVVNVSWYDAQMFISKLNQLTGKEYRLPTEAEWEFAARGGNNGLGYKFAGANNADAVAWYSKISAHQVHTVGQKKPNELGLYDMSGNVWQWCQDWFDPAYYKSSPVENPDGPRHGSYRVVRGGSWWSDEQDCRNANRDRYPADARDDDVGFRLVHD
jgi:sulfatase modifying factor 1